MTSAHRGKTRKTIEREHLDDLDFFMACKGYFVENPTNHYEMRRYVHPTLNGHLRTVLLHRRQVNDGLLTREERHEDLFREFYEWLEKRRTGA